MDENSSITIYLLLKLIKMLKKKGPRTINIEKLTEVK